MGVPLARLGVWCDRLERGPPGEHVWAGRRYARGRDLADALNNLAAQHRPREALILTAAREATAIYRELAASAPHYRPLLAQALTTLSLCHHQLSQPASALPQPRKPPPSTATSSPPTPPATNQNLPMRCFRPLPPAVEHASRGPR